MNDHSHNPDLVLPPFRVTRAAIDQIVALGGAVVIGAEDGGCCGTAWTFRRPADPDSCESGQERYGCPGAWLVVDEAVAALLPGATLDYAGQVKPPRFRVLSNPNTPQTCACRRSFGQPWPGPGQSSCRAYVPMPWDTAFDPPARWKRQTGYVRDPAPDDPAEG